jgi:hypothetical protein
MKHPSIVATAARMKPLPRRHRIAHLRALIGRETTASIRREELVVLLRAEMTSKSSRKDRAI